MAKYWKIISLLVVLVLVGFGLSYFSANNNVSEEPSIVSGVNELAEPVAATGNVDDTVKSLLQETNNDLVIFDEEAEDAALIELDNEAISDFGQSYGEL